MHAQGQAGRPGECLALADRLAAEVTLGPPVARGDDRDREAAVGDLDLIRHLEHGGVKELRDVAREQPHLARAVAGPQHPRLLAGAGKRARGVGRAVVDHVQGQVPAQAHGRPPVVLAGRLRDHDVVARLLDLDE